jgi:hypothetical protein
VSDFNRRLVLHSLICQQLLTWALQVRMCTIEEFERCIFSTITTFQFFLDRSAIFSFNLTCIDGNFVDTFCGIRPILNTVYETSVFRAGSNSILINRKIKCHVVYLFLNEICEKKITLVRLRYYTWTLSINQFWIYIHTNLAEFVSNWDMFSSRIVYRT